MENKDERHKLGYEIDELVKIGDHLHNSQTALVIADVLDEKGTHTTMGTATGRREDIVTMVYIVLKQNEDLADIITEAVMRKKMHDILTEFEKISKERGENNG